MALFDPDAQKVVVRVVYDGPGVAGKTTNLQQLCNVFTTFRRSELYSPDAAGGRTTYLDWLQIDSGLVAGRPLRSHFLTVPGQAVLARRRFQLVALADVIVFVVESTPIGVRDGGSHFSILKMYLDARGIEVPIVVQANKQDLEGALSAEEVGRRLGVDEGTPVVAAQAAAGVGVRETAVLAIRAAADRVQIQMRERGVQAMYGTAETGEELKARIQLEEERSPRSPVSLVLEHRRLADQLEQAAPETSAAPVAVEADAAGGSASAAVAAVGGSVPASDVSAASAAVPTPASDVPSAGETAPAPASRPSDGANALDADARHSAPDAKPFLAVTDDVDRRWEAPDTATSGEFAIVAALEPSALPGEPGSASDEPERSVLERQPPFPTPDVASGFVWPAATGRDILRRVPLDEAVFRAELRGSYGVAEGSGRTDTYVFEAGIWCMKTSPRRCFADIDEARTALLQLVRRKIQLGNMLPRDTVVSLARGDDGQLWMWTVTPWLTTLRGLMTSATTHSDEPALGAALTEYANAAISCAGLTARVGLVLDVHPTNFGIVGDSLFYLDDDISIGTSAPTLGYALLNRMDEYAAHPRALATYLEALCTAIRSELTYEESEALDLPSSIEAAVVRSQAAQDGKHVLLDVLSRTLRSVG